MNAAAVIVAAGRGHRLGAHYPKCLVSLCGRPIFLWALEPFLQLPQITLIALVAPPGYEAQFAQHLQACQRGHLVRLVTGGTHRPQSVLAGIAAVQPCAPALIAIHDGARPLVTSHLISRCLGAACQHRAAIAAAPSSDTLKQVRDGMVVSTLDRSSIWRAQTPQVFETELICEAYSRAGTEACHATDDAALVERLGVSPVIVDSDWTNVKITTPDDVIIAEALLRHRLNHWEGRSTLQ